MNVITIPKKTILDDFIVIPRKEYEALLELKKIAKNKLNDPDAGLELTIRAQKRLKSARRVKKGQPLSDIIKKYY